MRLHDELDLLINGDGPDCEHCGERLGSEGRAEVYNPAEPEAPSLLVHAEPCFAPELQNKGWEIA